jgi:hypothetical protein
MKHEDLAAKITARLTAISIKHEAKLPHAWIGDNLSRIYWGDKTYVEIHSNGGVTNSHHPARFTSPLHLKEEVEKAKALVLGRGW